MIHGIGTDIIEIERIQQAIDRHGIRFINKIFTKKEQAYASKHQPSSGVYAGRFAAKEAVIKALGTGFRDGISFIDIEIINDANGKPSVHLSDQLQKRFPKANILISISHCKEYATAFAIYA